MTVLISDKVHLKTSSVTWDKEGQFVIMKRPIHPEDLTIMNVFVLNNSFNIVEQKQTAKGRKILYHRWKSQHSSVSN